jgi:hypothetical protein
MNAHNASFHIYESKTCEWRHCFLGSRIRAVFSAFPKTTQKTTQDLLIVVKKD